MTKITSIKTTPVNVPLEAAYVWTYGLFPGFTQSIIEITTDDGITGIGEAPSASAAAAISNGFADRLIGRDPIDIQGCELACLPSYPGVQSVADFGSLASFGGIELALWDIRGKLWQRPVYELLGGAVRKSIPFTDYFVYREKNGEAGGEQTPEEVAEYCLRMKEEFGSTAFEGKMSEFDPKASIRLIEVLRKALGDDALIRVDSNSAYSVIVARMMAPALEELGVDNWEDPVGSYDELLRLRPHTRLSISGHNTDIGKAAAYKVPDAIVSGISGNGGFIRTLKLVAACEAAGIDFWCYSGDTGIQSAAYLHLCAASPWIRRPNQSLFHTQPLDVIEEGPFQLRNNLLEVPEGPGLGVTLSQDKLQHMHKLFVDNGPLNKYIDPANPGRMRRPPLA
ncbi:MAG: mandelate racemase/muconate lactonizing enzyme family protein [Aestuariivirgaceae bacterium]